MIALRNLRLAGGPALFQRIGGILHDGRQHAGAVGRQRRIGKAGQRDLHDRLGGELAVFRRVESALDVIGRGGDDQTSACGRRHRHREIAAAGPAPDAASPHCRSMRIFLTLRTKPVSISRVPTRSRTVVAGLIAETIVLARISSPLASTAPTARPFSTMILATGAFGADGHAGLCRCRADRLR